MEYLFKLSAKNRKSNINFETIEREHGIFNRAAENCSNGITFSRAGKSLMIMQIAPDHIKLILSSTSPLPSPTRTLSAFSRELIALNEGKGILDSLIYNHTLFKAELVDTYQDMLTSIDEITNADLLKAIIDLLYSQSDSYNTIQKNKAIDTLKETMLPFMKKKEVE